MVLKISFQKSPEKGLKTVFLHNFTASQGKLPEPSWSKTMNMGRLIKFSWVISSLMFLMVLLWVYAYMPDTVGIDNNITGPESERMSRETFFYLSLAIFAFANAALFALRKSLLLNTRSRQVAVSPSRKEGLFLDLGNWSLSFAAGLNFFFILSILYLGFFNNPEGRDFAHYAPVVYGGPVIIGILFIALIYILLKKRS